jgi:hypothetical protein
MTGFATYPSVRDRVAFVSGGASGLGAELVAQLAALLPLLRLDMLRCGGDGGRREAVSALLLPCHECRSATAPSAPAATTQASDQRGAARRLPVAGRGGRSGRVDRSRTAAEREPRLDRRAPGR